jgi:hypothetical protein
MGDTSVDVNEEWLEAAREVLGTDTKVATINAALPPSAVRRQAVNIVAAFDSVPMDFEGSVDSWGRDLSKLVTPVPRARRDGVKPRAASANLGEDSARDLEARVHGQLARWRQNPAVRP